MTSGVKDTTDIDRYQPLISMTLSDHLANIVIIFCSAWGKVTHFVSWCWAYSLNDVVSAIERWVQKSNEDARNVFLWMCFFCNNQYRIKEEAPKSSRGSCVTRCINSFAVHFCFCLWPLFYRWARNSGWITQVMCGGCIIKTYRDPVFWSLSFMCHDTVFIVA